MNTFKTFSKKKKPYNFLNDKKISENYNSIQNILQINEKNNYLMFNWSNNKMNKINNKLLLKERKKTKDNEKNFIKSKSGFWKKNLIVNVFKKKQKVGLKKFNILNSKNNLIKTSNNNIPFSNTFKLSPSLKKKNKKNSNLMFSQKTNILKDSNFLLSKVTKNKNKILTKNVSIKKKLKCKGKFQINEKWLESMKSFKKNLKNFLKNIK